VLTGVQFGDVVPEWKRWVDAYASSEPLLGFQKTNESVLVPTNDQVKKLLQGVTKFKLPSGYYLLGNEIKEFELTSMDHALRFEVHDQLDLQEIDPWMEREEVLKEESRFQAMLNYMTKLVVERPMDELLIIFVGATHALDLYFSWFLKPDLPKKDPRHRVHSDVLYSSPIVRNSSLFFTPDLYKFSSQVRGTEIKQKDIRESNVLRWGHLLARLHYYNRLKAGLISYEALIKERIPVPGVIVFMDTHNIREDEVYKKMPSAKTLAAMGFNKVKFANEMWKHDETYKLDDLKQNFYMDATSIENQEDREWYQRFRKQAFQALQKGFIFNVGYQALYEKLKSYQDSGLGLSLTGVEDFDRRPKVKSNENKESPAVVKP